MATQNVAAANSVRSLDAKPNTSFIDEVIAATPGEARLKICLQCGTCGGSCPSGPDMDYTPRKIFAILVDAIFTGRDPAGTVSCFPLEALPDLASGHINSAHDASLKQAIQVGRAMDACLPDAITIVAVEAENLYQFSDELSPPVAAAVVVNIQWPTTR